MYGSRRVHNHIAFPSRNDIASITKLWRYMAIILSFIGWSSRKCSYNTLNINLISSRNTSRQTMQCKLRFFDITVNAPVGSEGKPQLNHWFCCILNERIISVWHESGGPGSDRELLAPLVATQLERRRDNMSNELILEQYLMQRIS